MAERANCIIEMVPQVGDFVAVGDPLFRVYRGGTSDLTRPLLQSVAVGVERTLEQDPMFAFRIIVDIASKGLSPAINDPTTGVLALDQLHHLLRNLGSRELKLTAGCEIRADNCGFSIAPQTGRNMCTWRSRKSAISAGQAFRSPDG